MLRLIFSTPGLSLCFKNVLLNHLSFHSLFWRGIIRAGKRRYVARFYSTSPLWLSLSFVVNLIKNLFFLFLLQSPSSLAILISILVGLRLILESKTISFSSKNKSLHLLSEFKDDCGLFNRRVSKEEVEDGLKDEADDLLRPLQTFLLRPCKWRKLSPFFTYFV